MPLDDKYARLKELLRTLESAVVAFSGGVDSTLLLRVAKDVLGANRVLALTVTSPIHSRHEFDRSRALAAAFGVRQGVIEGRELSLPDFVGNRRDRCYHCKKALFSVCRAQAAERGFAAVLDGSNLDDLDDFRPGRQAAVELQVRSPLLEAGLGKADIRQLSRRFDLSTWNMQPFACLATRFPYGIEITTTRLAQVERCEALLRQREFRNYRVRYHGDTARIEIAPDEIPRLLEAALREELVRECKAAGFTYVALDLQGYRMGSMNESGK